MIQLEALHQKELLVINVQIRRYRFCVTISDLSQSLVVFKWKKLEGKMAEIKSLIKELEIDLSRVTKGKPPLNNAEGKPKKNINPEVLEKYI